MLLHYVLIHDDGQVDTPRATTFFPGRVQIFRGIRRIVHVANTFASNCIRHSHKGLQCSFGIFPRVAKPAAKVMKFVIS